ncbi:protein kinase [Dactylosporangium vinaceum]|uniref:non-specific serine/threonine protein kinase n=1 Tax=Dactylosporangium vinaceum TaxID=53362 RepID=A0ABV5MHH7_9ACTN|nr:protein kinase [Dactylosporangium vinaceum]UAB94794.1 protein kinase [Dactylosporangium vinaceum]
MKTLVDRYRLDYAIGAGGMGIVWRARDLRQQQMVAIKEVRLPELMTTVERERVNREARAAGRVEHPAIVKVHEVVTTDEGPWIVMDLVDGRSLGERVATDGPLPAAEGARLGLVLLDALEAAHAAGITHGDVKPANVLLLPDGSALLTDFAVAAMLDPRLPLSDPVFVAPERRGTGDGGPEGDLYSLGATLAVASPAAAPDLVAALTADDPAERPNAHAVRRALSIAAGVEPPPEEEPWWEEPAEAAATTAAATAEATAAAETQEQPAVDEATKEHPVVPLSTPAETTGELRAAKPATPAGPQRMQMKSEIKVAALIGAGVLAFLILVGFLGHGGGTTDDANQAAQGAVASPSDDALLAGAGTEPSPSPSDDQPSPSAAPSTARPTTKAPKTTKPASPTPPKSPAVTSAKIGLNPVTYSGPCTGNGIDVEVSVTIATNQPGTQVTYATTGKAAKTVTATGGTYTETYRMRVDSGRRYSFPMTLSVTSPGTTTDSLTFTNNCSR